MTTMRTTGRPFFNDLSPGGSPRPLRVQCLGKELQHLTCPLPLLRLQLASCKQLASASLPPQVRRASRRKNWKPSQRKQSRELARSSSAAASTCDIICCSQNRAPVALMPLRQPWSLCPEPGEHCRILQAYRLAASCGQETQRCKELLRFCHLRKELKVTA